MANENAKLDPNGTKTLLAVSDDVNQELRRLLVDPATGRLKVQAIITGGIAIGDTVTSGTAGSILFVGAGPVLAQNNAQFFWDNTNFRLGLGTTAPTNTLTIASTGDGIYQYNTADQTTNYERAVIRMRSNIMVMGTEFGGTGVSRNLVLGVGSTAGTNLESGRTFRISAALPFYQFSAQTSLAGVLFDYSGISISSTTGSQTCIALNPAMGGGLTTSGTQTAVSISPTSNMSGTSNYIALDMNVTETAIGSGTNYLIRAATAGTRRFTVNRNGFTSIGNGDPSALVHLFTGSYSLPAWGSSGVGIRLDALTFTDTSTAGSGTVASSNINSIAAPVIAATNASVTYSDPATLQISAPTAGTNVTISGIAYALRVSGASTTTGFSYGPGGFATSTAGGVTNFLAVGGQGTSTTANSTDLLSTATTMRYRVKGSGTTSDSMSVSDGFSNWILGSGALTVAGSGTHPIVTTLGIRPPTLTGTAATITDLATVYINGAPTYGGTVTNGPYALKIASGKAKFTSTVNTLVTATDSATVTFDLATGNDQRVTLGGNRTLALSNVEVGMHFTLMLIQDGTGSRTVTWFSGIKWAGGSAPTLTTTANKIDVFTFVCTSAGNYLGFIGGQNM